MKNKTTQNQTNIFPIQVAGTPRQCGCGVGVRRGIMWEYKTMLYCSKLCAQTAERKETAQTENDNT